ncbi:MAG: hypothetical protein GX676_04255 [Bacilli bacterium]|nr:hypothetical protein [Bacilli bacterium]
MRDLLFVLIIVNAILIVINASFNYQIMWLLIVNILVTAFIVVTSIVYAFTNSKNHKNKKLN